MSLSEILLVALALAMDAFAVSLDAGATEYARSGRARFRLAFHFGLFQCLMPIAGWLVGTSVARAIESVDHWVAFGLLAFVGVRMLVAAFRQEGSAPQRDPSRGATLVMLSVATSIDALAIGLTLAMLEVEIWYASAIIGVVTGLLSLAAIGLGSRLGARFGRRMEAVGGTILIALGARILFQHLGRL
jgi:manganese efflux pump family protein